MGGCRCSYRNCTIRSDGGITHMFHYPVYDKQRCRQWLVNARNLDFLDLSVSQLKNRVICQHHFKEDAFMNSMHNKLKHDAIPTLNGPYVKGVEMLDDDNVNEILDSDLSHLLIDDIENEVRLTVGEKQARQVLKYVDFLTSNDTESIVPKSEKQDYLNDSFQECALATTLLKDERFFSDASNIYTKSPRKKPIPEKTDRQKIMIELEPLADKKTKAGKSKPKNKIKIISEKTITGPPVISSGEMIVVSPSTIINPQRKSFKTANPTPVQQQANYWDPKDSLGNNVQIIIDNNIRIDDMPIVFLDENNAPTSLVNPSGVNEPAIITELVENPEIKPTVPSLPVKKSNPCIKTKAQASPGAKSKIPPERIAAIEEKRNFNKKLRDMIEFCLDELDDPSKVASIKHKLPSTPSPITVKSEKILKKPSKAQISSTNKNSILQTSKKEQNVEDNHSISTIKDGRQEISQNVSLNQVTNTQALKNPTLASLEARMAKMEHHLAQKIENNTQQILELKDYVTAPETMFSQTPTEHEEVFKKRLYKEISKFLSPNANSLVYEELFINKFGKEVLDDEESTMHRTYSTRSAKRQKRR